MCCELGIAENLINTLRGKCSPTVKFINSYKYWSLQFEQFPFFIQNLVDIKILRNEIGNSKLNKFCTKWSKHPKYIIQSGYWKSFHQQFAICFVHWALCTHIHSHSLRLPEIGSSPWASIQYFLTSARMVWLIKSQFVTVFSLFSLKGVRCCEFVAQNLDKFWFEHNTYGHSI